MRTKFFTCLFFLFFLGLLFFTANSCKKDDDDNNQPQVTELTDVEGNVYSVVTIGSQIWMAENLKVTKMNDESDIPDVTGNVDWSNRTSPAYCWYDNNVTHKNPYGAMYNWYAVSSDSLCPEGWHVPTDGEWMTLLNYLGGDSIAGGKLKEEGTANWANPNTGASNETGFTGLPGGRRYFSGAYKYFSNYGYYWSKTETGVQGANCWRMAYNSAEVITEEFPKQAGLSVRCVKD